jgi:hypothetical protein
MNRQLARRWILGWVLITAFVAVPASAQDFPTPPQAFYGSVTVNGQPAPVGARIEARGLGVLADAESGNPITVAQAGQYGVASAAGLKLGVQGNIEDTTPIEFYVDGVKAQCAVPGGPWQPSYPFQSGVVTELNLSVGAAGQAATATATATSTPMPIGGSGRTTAESSVVATATRGTSQTTAGAGAPTATAPASGSAASLAATATAARAVVVATPTTPAAPVDTAATPSATPALQPSATPSATAALATPAEPPTLTPAVLAQAPRATSNPILDAGAKSPAEQTPAPPASGPTGAASGRTLALAGGLAALAIATAAGVLVWVRGRPR